MHTRRHFLFIGSIGTLGALAACSPAQMLASLKTAKKVSAGFASFAVRFGSAVAPDLVTTIVENDKRIQALTEGGTSDWFEIARDALQVIVITLGKLAVFIPILPGPITAALQVALSWVQRFLVPGGPALVSAGASDAQAEAAADVLLGS